jgi:6-phosphogluconolactonase (cycloisomerase 2 family)
MRMKFNKSSQLLLVSAASLVLASLVTACGTLTVDFVFVTSSKAAGSNNYGEVNVFEINSESGHMRQIPTSPFPSGGRNPVAEAVSADNSNLYVVNQDDNSIVQFIIGNDGKLYPQNTITTAGTENPSGIFPLAVAVSGKNLFVANTYQPLPTCSNAAPCSGSVAVFPITSSSTSPPSDTLGTPLVNPAISANYWPLSLAGKSSSDVIVPTALAVLNSGSNAYVYVTAYDSSVTPSVGYVFGFASNAGVLTALGGSPWAAGTMPAGIAATPGIGSSATPSVYVSDSVNGVVLGYSVASGVLTPLNSGTGGTNQFAAGSQPGSLVVDPVYSYLYVANMLDSSVEAYSISNGALSRIGTYATGIQPVAIGIDPSTNHFLYTANFLGNDVSGFELSATDGSLINTQNSPFPSNAQPTAVAAIPHGAAAK